jgi:hypothetical protein
MLLELLIANRGELIRRCRAKATTRFGPSPIPQVIEHGVPLFLDQVADILAREKTGKSRPAVNVDVPLTSTAIGRSAALHGVELMHLGYSVDQVVRHYGDVCQSVAELAIEQHVSVSADQFRTLNRCLDEAIADAVSAFAAHHETRVAGRAERLHERIGLFADNQRRVITLAIETFSALKSGQLGLSGAVGTVLQNLMYELRDEVDRALPELRLATGMTSPSALADAISRQPRIDRRRPQTVDDTDSQTSISVERRRPENTVVAHDGGAGTARPRVA